MLTRIRKKFIKKRDKQSCEKSLILSNCSVYFKSRISIPIFNPHPFRDLYSGSNQIE